MPTTDTIVRNIFVKAEESITLTNNGAVVVTGNGSTLPVTMDLNGRKVLVQLEVESPSTGDGAVDAAIDASLDEETWLVVDASLGLNLDTGVFATSESWTPGTGWSITGGVASSDGTQAADADLTQALGLTPGAVYQTRMAVANRAAGNVTAVVGDTEGADHAADGTFVEYVTAGAGTDFDVRADQDFIGDVDGITLKLVTPGADLVTNGAMAADASWTKGVGWSIPTGYASSDGTQAGDADLTQVAGLTPAGLYQTTLTVANYAAGNVAVVVGDQEGADHAANGTFVEYITAGAGTDFDVRADLNFIGDVDTVLVKAATVGTDLVTNGVMAADTDWTKGAGWSIPSGYASSDGTQVADADLTQAAGLTPAAVYQTSFVVSNYSAGNVTPVVGDQEGTDRAANGTHVEFVTCGAGTDFDLRADLDFVGDVDAVQIKLATAGSDLVTNGAMAADTDWVKGDGWTIAADVASSDGTQVADSDLTQTIAVTPGNIYRVTFAVSGYVAGNVRAVVGDALGTNRAADGTFTEYITCGAGGDIDLRADADFVGNVDGVVVEEISLGANIITNGTFDSGTGWTLGTGWTISSQYAACDGTQVADSDLTQTIAITPGVVYRVTFTVSNRSAGNVCAVVGDQEGTDRAANGTFVEYITAGAGGDLDIRADLDFVGRVDSVIAVPITMGANVITNGTFATAADWTLGTGWAITTGYAASDGSQAGDADLTQAIAVTQGDIVQVTFTVSGWSAGNVCAVVGDTEGTDRAANGTFVQYITCGAGGDIDIRADLNFIGRIDNVMAKVVSLGPDLILTGLSTVVAIADLTNWAAPYWRLRIFTDGTDLLDPTTIKATICSLHVASENFYSSSVLTP